MVDNSYISNFKINQSLKFILFIILLVFLLDGIFGNLMKTIFNNIDYGTYGKINKALSTNSE